MSSSGSSSASEPDEQLENDITAATQGSLDTDSDIDSSTSTDILMGTGTPGSNAGKGQGCEDAEALCEELDEATTYSQPHPEMTSHVQRKACQPALFFFFLV